MNQMSDECQINTSTLTFELLIEEALQVAAGPEVGNEPPSE